MKISAVIPAYNCENYITEAINSIINQTVKVDEIIVVNDGSTDSTLQVLKAFGNQITVVDQLNKGICKSLNLAIKLSKGDYIAFLDADDIWEFDKIENQLMDIEKNPEYSIFVGAIRQFVSPEIINHTYVFKEYPQKSYTKITCLASRKLFLNDGWFKEEERFNDFFEWIALMKSKNEKIYFSEKILGQRRIRPNSHSQSEEYYPSLLKFLKNRIDSKRKNEQNIG
jgi:glycosyltransferase involved in cell wall biosynthesis